MDLQRNVKFESLWFKKAMSWCLVVFALFSVLMTNEASAQSRNTQQESNTYTSKELVDSGHRFFGSVSKGLATAVESAVSRYGRPNGYILGQEGSGAFLAGLRYGEGTLYTKREGQRKIFWQGPSFGIDVGADGARTMMLVYNMPSSSSLEGRFGGVDGSAYLVAGFGITALARDNITVVPIRSGVGARLGVNVGYLKFSRSPTWMPF